MNKKIETVRGNSNVSADPNSDGDIKRNKTLEEKLAELPPERRERIETEAKRLEMEYLSQKN